MSLSKLAQWSMSDALPPMTTSSLVSVLENWPAFIQPGSAPTNTDANHNNVSLLGARASRSLLSGVMVREKIVLGLSGQ